MKNYIIWEVLNETGAMTDYTSEIKEDLVGLAGLTRGTDLGYHLGQTIVRPGIA